MVTGLVSPTECEVKRPMRSLDEMGSRLLDPRVSLPGSWPVRQELPHRPAASSGAGVPELKGAAPRPRWRGCALDLAATIARRGEEGFKAA
jgi:hypothetical protein